MFFGLFGDKDDKVKKTGGGGDNPDKVDMRAMIKAQNQLERLKAMQPRSVGAPITDESIEKDIYNGHFASVIYDIADYNFKYEIVDPKEKTKEEFTTPPADFDALIHFIENVGIRMTKNMKGEMIKLGETDIKACKQFLEILFNNFNKFVMRDELSEDDKKTIQMKQGNEAVKFAEAQYFGGGKMKIWFTLQSRMDIRYGTAELQAGKPTIYDILKTNLNITNHEIKAFVQNMVDLNLINNLADFKHKVDSDSPFGKRLMGFLQQ